MNRRRRQRRGLARRRRGRRGRPALDETQPGEGDVRREHRLAPVGLDGPAVDVAGLDTHFEVTVGRLAGERLVLDARLVDDAAARLEAGAGHFADVLAGVERVYGRPFERRRRRP